MAEGDCAERAQQLLSEALQDQPVDVELARSLARDGCSDALFRIVVEGLADRFEPRLCTAYAEIFSAVLADASAGQNAEEWKTRYARVRIPRPCRLEPRCVFILSRVTLGADIAITSVLLHAAKRRFPNARIVFVGSPKNAELWAADPRIEHLAAPYPRTGSLAGRLEASYRLHSMLDRPDSIVLDPDSRLTQLGLVPVCAEERYFFFESRGYGGARAAALQTLASEWCVEVLGISEAHSYLAISAAKQKPQTAISFGVGENPAKHLGDAFEAGLLQALGGRIVIDSGAGGDEAARVESAVAASGADAEIWRGSFAGFAAQIAESTLYVGYDSAGQHAAAAVGTPLLTVFAGHVSQRMLQRWRPCGAGPIEIIDSQQHSPQGALQQTLSAVHRLRTL